MLLQRIKKIKVLLLRYFIHIIDDKVKIRNFLSGLPQTYKDIIEFDEPQTLDETIRKAKYYYDQRKIKQGFHKAWTYKKKEKFDQRKRGFNPPHFKI